MTEAVQTAAARYTCSSRLGKKMPSLEIVSPAPESCYPVIWRLLQEFSHQTIDMHAPKNLEELVERAKKGEAGGGMYCAVLKDGVVVGGVWVEPMVDDIGLGHLVFEREGISSAEKMKAARMALSEIFDAGFRKVLWMFFADNRAFRIFLKRLGAEYEGTLKKHLRRDGMLIDAEMMASFPEEGV